MFKWHTLFSHVQHTAFSAFHVRQKSKHRIMLTSSEVQCLLDERCVDSKLTEANE